MNFPPASRFSWHTKSFVISCFALLTLAGATPSQERSREQGYQGRPVRAVLEELRDRGVPLVWSSSVVGNDLAVIDEPTAERPLRALRQMLRSHGLTLEKGARQIWMVVPLEREARSDGLVQLTGVVVDSAGEPASGVRVLLPDHNLEETTDQEGRFAFTPLPPGQARLEVLTAAAGAPQVVASEELLLETPREGSAQETPHEVSLVVRVEQGPMAIDSIDVVSRISLLEDTPVTGVSLDEEAIDALPHFGDDLLRAAKALPGVASGDLTADFQVRGGLADEVLYRLDGLELYEPFHLRDVNGLFSLFDPQIMAGVELIPGNFPAEFGDRSAGVLDMTTTIEEATRGNAGVSFSNLWLGGGGSFDEERGHWLASARRGYLDLVLDLAGEDDDDDNPDPEYWDAFGKLDYQVSERNRVAFQTLIAEDRLELTTDEPDEILDFETTFVDRYAWIRHQGTTGKRVSADTVFSVAQIDHDRFTLFRDFRRRDMRLEESFDLDDDRRVDLVGLRQDWHLQLAAERPFSHLLKFGAELRAFDVFFDYAATAVLEDPINDPRFSAGLVVPQAIESFDGEHWSVYASDRFRVGPRLVVEAGVRYDEQTLTDSDQVSPRLHLLLPMGRTGTLRAAWGHYFQSQKPHELEVQFGETAFQRAQRDVHWSLGWEHYNTRFGTLRVEAYRRENDRPLRRYETVFDAFRPLPQIAPGLTLIAPQRSESEGLEIYLAGRSDRPLTWFASFGLAETVDVLPDGTRQPRFFDQENSLTAALFWRPGLRWTFATVLRYHSGWPTTAISATVDRNDDPRQLNYEIGPFYAEDLADYASVDVRIKRTSLRKRGAFSIFLDVQNLLDRENRRGHDLEDFRFVDCQADGICAVEFRETDWLGHLSAWVFVGHMTRAKFGLEVSNVEDETKSSEDEGPLVRKAQGLCGPASSSRRVA